MDEKKPTVKIAAALRYDPGTDGAPRVTAKGRGILAEKILEIAANHDIPVKREPDLAKMLYLIDIDDEIPEQLYRAVAEILAFLYAVNDRLR